MKARTVTLEWADGEYPFALNIGQARELEAKQATGIGAIYQRLTLGAWYADDIYQVIRLGLIGGGMAPPEAMRLANLYVAERPMAENQPIALAIMLAAFFGSSAEKAQVSETEAAAPLTE